MSKTQKYSSLERLFTEIKRAKTSLTRTQSRIKDLEEQANVKLDKFGLRYRDL